MTPTEADSVIEAIRARRPFQWSPEMLADFRAAMLKFRIDGEQGRAAAINVILTSKFPPTPAHYLEAFAAAQGLPQATTGSPRAQSEGFRGADWHPRGWAIVLAWKWAWDEKNWPVVAQWMPEFAETSGWMPNWECVIDPNRAGDFTSREVEQLGLWMRERIGRKPPSSTGDLWAERQREIQARRVKTIAELRAKQGAKA